MKFNRLTAVILGFLTGCGVPASSTTGADAEAKRLAAAGALVLDVRTPEEFASGHIQGATNVPVDQVERRIGSVAPDKNAPVLLHCRSGRRSAMAKSILDRQGYTQVIDLGSLDHARQVIQAGR